MRLNSLPRVKLANLPTPLQELHNLTKVLKGPRIFAKRDDMTGLAFGGNKTRKLEYLMADTIANKADYIVTGAGFHSNWCTQATAAACKLGVKIVLIKTGPKDDYKPEEYDGNHLLHILMGAEIKVVRPENFKRVLDDTVESLKEEGHRPYILSDAGSTPLGVAGYISAMFELESQAMNLGVDFDYLIHATGSGGTQAGLIIGAKALNLDMKIIGASTGGRTADQQAENVYKIISESSKALNLNIGVNKEDVIVKDEYAGGGYGFMSKEKIEAVRIVAESDGLILDPVYTSTSMACLIDLCRKGFLTKKDSVVFLHTGGSAALFPYKECFKAYALEEALPWIIPSWSPFSEKT